MYKRYDILKIFLYVDDQSLETESGDICVSYFLASRIKLIKL